MQFLTLTAMNLNKGGVKAVEVDSLTVYCQKMLSVENLSSLCRDVQPALRVRLFLVSLHLNHMKDINQCHLNAILNGLM